MAEHPDFTIQSPTSSNQSLEIRNRAGDVVRLTSDSMEDRAVLAGALDSCLVIFQVIKKRGS